MSAPETTPSVVFAGFPAAGRATPVPSIFFSQLLPVIEDEAELRVTLYMVYALGRRKGYPRFVTQRELRAEAPLLASLGDGSEALPLERMERGLAAAVERGSLLRLDLEHDGRVDALFFLNTPYIRRAVSLIRQGQLDLGRPLPPEQAPPASKRENVFLLYEENIGPLTPLVAEELREAEQLYPYEWLEEALREAAVLNKRSWRYASRILQRWATEGRGREKAGRAPGEGDSARAQFLRRYRGLGGD
jgi:DnaD/phage-associated family protein